MSKYINKYIDNNQLHSLKKDIFPRAKIFIEQIGEFAPFGSILIGGHVKPIAFFDEADKEDLIDSVKAVKVLKKQISKEIKNAIVDAAAIAYDVAVNIKNSDGVSEKRDALCLEFTSNGEDWIDEYFPYMIIDGQCVWR
ncbi:hypothetical protein [Sphingobacterium multivorum]|uniref:hypothetical protein n=1 Tax=Sphingobacterium multivorum TaxID=28454 RepID=UPI003DA3FB94